MPRVRNRTVRKKKVITDQPEVTDAEKLRRISALYIVVFNDDASITAQATELFHLLGDLLEGKPLSELSMQTISYADFLRAYEDLASTTKEE